jgi:VWFA-related protein
MRRPVPIWLLAALGAFSTAMIAQTAPAVTGAQSPEDTSKAPFVLKTSTHLVLVDVIAANGKGEPVTDLTAEDFVISEDGHPQIVRSFNLQQPAHDRNDLQAMSQPLPPGVVTNIPRHTKGAIWNVIVLDALNSPMLDQSDTRQQLLKVLEKLPDQPVAIYVLGARLRLIQDFSSDPAVLEHAIAGLKNKASALLDNPKGGHEGERYPAAFFGALPEQAKASILRWEGESTASRTRNRLQITLEALNAIAANLKPLPGRKNLIWVSEGFPFAIEPGTVVPAHESVSDRDYTVAVSKTANALFDSQVAIYPIDSRGMVLSQVYDPASRGFDAIGQGESQIGLKSTVSEQNNNLDVTHASMQEVAERTGGKAFYNRNEIGNAIVESMNDGATYYTLSYSPSNRDWNGKFRRISVRSRRSGVKLRYRLGYFAIQPAAMASRQEQIAAFEHAMDISSPASTALLFQARVFPPSDKTQNQVVVNYSIAAAGLSFEKGPDQLQHASVNCAVEAYSSKGELVKKDGTTLTAALQPEVYDKVVREGFPCQEKLALPAGDYILRLGVRDNTTGDIGTTDTQLSISAEQPY